MAVADGLYAPLLSFFFSSQYSKADPYDLQEVVEQLSKESSRQLWLNAENLCKAHLLDRNLLSSDEDEVSA